LKQDAKVIHVNNWEKFKKLAIDHRPSSVSYTIQRAPLSKPPVGLRMVFATKESQYVFLDFARGEAMQRTMIPVRRNEKGEAYISEEEIRNFLLTQLGRSDLAIYSFEVLGY
jgi:hypothetical protein